jgi:type II secretory pathway pseudopilin PulG
MSRKALWLIAILALLAGAWWAWQTREAPKVPAERQAQEAVATATEAVASADKAIKKGRAILRAIPGEVKAVEKQAEDSARSADLGVLAGRANDRIREWVRRHPTGNAVGSSDAGAGSVLAGGSSEN